MVPLYGDMQWCSWLRQCTTNQQVAVLIPDGVIGIFHWHKPSSRTQSLTELSIMGKDGQCVQLMKLPPSCADCHEIWKPQPPVTLKAYPGLEGDSFNFTFAFAAMVQCLIKHRFNFTFIRGIHLEFGFMIHNVCLNVTWMRLCVL